MTDVVLEPGQTDILLDHGNVVTPKFWARRSQQPSSTTWCRLNRIGLKLGRPRTVAQNMKSGWPICCRFAGPDGNPGPQALLA